MPPFKDDQIIVIAPGSQVTLAQLGLPESFTPARLRIRSRMFPAEKEGEWEPYKIREKIAPRYTHRSNGGVGEDKESEANEEDAIKYEEDLMSDEGAVWPIQEGRITNWSCFFALITHVYNSLSPPFHTPILLIAEPVWTPREHEKLTQFFFERFKMPAFALMDAAVATTYAYGLHTSTIVDIGKDKADVTAITDFMPHNSGRAISLPNCGGETMTQRLHELLSSKDFTRDMCEQLKKSPVCEILPAGTPLPGSSESPIQEKLVGNPAAAASTGAADSGPERRGSIGIVPRGPGPDTEVGDEQNDDDNEGVLDVANIVTSGKMSEFLAKKEKEKQEKAATKKKGVEAALAQSKPTRLPNSKRERNTFMFEDLSLLDSMKNMELNGQKSRRPGQDPSQQAQSSDNGTENNGEIQGAAKDEANGVADDAQEASNSRSVSIRREVEVGLERFQAASGGILERLADAIHRTINSVESVNRRSELWDTLIICGNGSRIRGFKDALFATLNSKYIISPSSATIFTSELPSNISTPAGTGANTPQPQLGLHGGGSSSHVNPLLYAATTAQNPLLQHHGSSAAAGVPGQHALPSLQSHNVHSSHGQTPTSIKAAKPPDYFPEWKEAGYDEAAFLGAQVAAKVLFVVDQGLSKGYMTRPDYNEQGPTGIHDFSM